MDREIIREDLEHIFSTRSDWNRLDGKTVLVTGGYGMLASYIVFFLIYLNEIKNINVNIVCQGRSPEKMKARFKEYVGRDYFFDEYWSLDAPAGSGCKSAGDDKMPETVLYDTGCQADYIVHAASPANPSFYGRSPVDVEIPNALGTYFLLEYARKVGTEGFLYFSTGDVYGQMQGMSALITEDDYGTVDPLDIHSCYGESKRMGETWCASYSRQYGVPAKIARIAHTYGPTMDTENDPRVFSSFVKDILDGRDIELLSDGTSRRSFCYIADAVVSFFLILFEGEPGEAYNVSNSGQFLSVGELAEILTGIVPERGLKVVRKTRQDDGYTEATFNKANMISETKLKELGWKPDISVEEGFDRVIRALGC